MKIRTQLITGFSLLAAIMVVMQIATFISLSSLSTSEEWLVHTYRVIGAARQSGRLVLELESGMQGFLLTGDESYLEHHMEAENQYEETITELKAQVADNPPQVARLTKIEQLLVNWHETVSKPAVELRRQMDRQAQDGEAAAEQAVAMQDIEAMVRSGENNHFLETVRTLIRDFISVEQQLVEERRHATELAKKFNRMLLITGTAFFLIIGGITLVTVLRNVFRQVGGEPDVIKTITKQIADGDLEDDGLVGSTTGILAAVQSMRESLKKNQEEITSKNWLSDSLADLADTVRGAKATAKLCEDIISCVARRLDLQVGTLSLADADQTELTLTGSYAYKQKPGAKTVFRFGEGLIGQAAQDKRLLSIQDIPDDTLTVTSALGELPPANIYCLPLLLEGRVEGVIELGSLRPLTDLQQQFLKQSTEPIAITIHTARSREKIKTLLEESQSQTEELQTQAEELQSQQEELRVTNEELQEKASELEMLVRTSSKEARSEI